MEPEGSLPHSQASATCPYPEPARSSPYPHIPLTEDPCVATYNVFDVRAVYFTWWWLRSIVKKSTLEEKVASEVRSTVFSRRAGGGGVEKRNFDRFSGLGCSPCWQKYWIIEFEIDIRTA